VPDDETDVVHLVDLVRKGYNALSYRYRSDDADDGGYAPWLAALHNRLPARTAVLDLGCGCGVPVARSLVAAGHQVTGVDVSEVQIGRARGLVPMAAFIRADATKIEFAAGSFDAVVCLYAMIHMPLAAQPALIGRIARWLRPASWLLMTVGQNAWTGSEQGWLGGNAVMWWSQSDAASYARWLDQAGLEIVEQSFVAEDDGGHALFWARRPGGSCPA
jgi:2-polyprenyl-3-methyl-5-hydroxy-6-metoxy-1,4-benzoquinol methylase